MPESIRENGHFSHSFLLLCGSCFFYVFAWFMAVVVAFCSGAVSHCLVEPNTEIRKYCLVFFRFVIVYA